MQRSAPNLLHCVFQPITKRRVALSGDRRGQRSIRLNLQWRAIYVVARDGSVQFVSVEEAMPHEY